MRIHAAHALALAVISCTGDAPVDAPDDVLPAAVVELDRIAILGFTNAPSAPTPMFSHMDQLADGSFLLTIEKGTSTVLHFAADGSYLAERVRPGQGPGEVVEVQAITVDGDSLWLVDPVAGRCNVYDASSVYGVTDDSRLEYVRSFRCVELSVSDLARAGGEIFATGFGPLGLLALDATSGSPRQAWASSDTLPTGEYASLAAGSDGVWFVPHPNEYRLELWLPGASEPDRVLERTPGWWEPVAGFDLTVPDGSMMPEDRQTLAGPILWNVGVRDGLVWTASYVLTREGKTYMEFINDWVELGLQGDTRVHVEALTPRGELVASGVFDGMAPPRFTSNGLLYTTETDGLDVRIAVFRPRVVEEAESNP